MKSTYKKVKNLGAYFPLLSKEGLKVIGKSDQTPVVLILTYKNTDMEGSYVFS